MASEKLNLGKTVLAFLKTHTGEKFTARQIAEWIFEA
ncbi:HrgA protein, partial [Ralstonia pseudosolanacearum]